LNSLNVIIRIIKKIEVIVLSYLIADKLF